MFKSVWKPWHLFFNLRGREGAPCSLIQQFEASIHLLQLYMFLPYGRIFFIMASTLELICFRVPNLNDFQFCWPRSKQKIVFVVYHYNKTHIFLFQLQNLQIFKNLFSWPDTSHLLNLHLSLCRLHCNFLKHCFKTLKPVAPIVLILRCFSKLFTWPVTL